MIRAAGCSAESPQAARPHRKARVKKIWEAVRPSGMIGGEWVAAPPYAQQGVARTAAFRNPSTARGAGGPAPGELAFTACAQPAQAAAAALSVCCARLSVVGGWVFRRDRG